MDSPNLARLLEKVRARADTYAYFFDNIDSAAWIAPLRAQGFFSDPVEVEHLEGGYVRFPLWPESRTLARLAASDQVEVIETILACSDTDNPRVHDDFLDAALQMSPERAARLVPLIKTWLKKPFKLLVPRKAGELLTVLAEAGLQDAAIALAQDLFALSKVERFEGFSEFHPSYDDWDYQEVLKENAPAFVRGVGIPGLQTLIDSLSEVLRSEDERFGGQPHDASYIWRPSIADHEQNSDREPRSFLVSSIRDGSHDLIETERSSVQEVVALFEAQGWHLFDRVAMEIATTFAVQAPSESVRLLLRRDLLDSYEVSHEYIRLIEAALPLADDQSRSLWFSWVLEGPDVERFSAKFRARNSRDPTADELNEWADTWRWNRIAFAPEQALDAEVRPMRESLASRFDAPSSMPFAVYSSFGTKRPMSEEEASAKTTAELAAYAEGIPSAENRFESQEEGFGMVLADQARERPADASSELARFKSLRPVYMRSIVSGLREAANAQSPDINWSSVLEIAEWVLEQPRELEDGSGGSYSDLDPGWVWTISTLADLLEEGLQHRLIPLRVREQLWSVLTLLSGEPEDEVSSDDPATDSLNTIRGKTMHAVILYADWLYEQDQSEERVRDFGHNSPEVAEVLDAALDPQMQPSRSARAALGMRAAFLMKLDPTWLRTRAPRLFSTSADGSFDEIGLAAWNSYVRYSRIFLDLTEALRPQYEVAVASLVPANERPPTEAERSLAEHLMVMYWHGQLGSGPFDNPFLVRFWERANKPLRKRALEYVGHNLWNAGNDVDDDVRDRLMKLWEEYVDSVTGDRRTDVAELTSFGWWTRSTVFDPSWQLDQVITVLELAHGIDDEQGVLGLLARVPPAQLGRSAKALRLLVINDREGFAVVGHNSEIRELLAAALETGIGDVVEEATTTVNLMVSRGYVDFRELLGG
jgi:hypothetical protein